jgi:hypothetical protein
MRRRHMVSKAVFEEAFWDCYHRFTVAATEDVGVPGYFRFITLLGELSMCHAYYMVCHALL